MTASELIVKLTGEVGSYADLSQAVDLAIAHMPYKPCLKHDIFPIISADTGRACAAVSKSISRAAQAMWDNGDRKKLVEIVGNGFDSQAPPAKELILCFAYFLAYDTPYHTIPSGGSEKYPLIQNRPKQPREKREYVTVRADHFPDGTAKPLMFRTEGGPPVRIGRMLGAVKVAFSAGGQAVRYTCQTRDRLVYLFCEDGRWYWSMAQ